MNVIKCFRISISLHVNLYECKQSHVSDIISSRRGLYMQIFGNLITVSCSGKAIEDTYSGIYPKYIVLAFILQLIGLLLKL